MLIFQEKLSEKVRQSNREYDFFIHYVKDSSKLIPGVLEYTEEAVKFITMQREVLMEILYENILPYSLALYAKEDLRWNGALPDKPEAARCFKFERRKSKNEPEIFCVFYSRSDIGMRSLLNLVEARWAADMYAIKLNIRLQRKLLNLALRELSRLKTPTMDFEDSMLVPIKNQIRNEYFQARHQLVNYVKLGKLDRSKFNGEIEKLKRNLTFKVCNSITVCVKAIEYSLEKGLLPLSGTRERFSMDLQNPYNSLMPKTFLRIPLPNGGELGKKLMEKMLSLKGGKIPVEGIPESMNGEIPNLSSIKKAFNTMAFLRDRTVRFFSIEQMQNNCRSSVRHNSNHLRRKVALLPYMGNKDVFFKFFGSVRDRQMSWSA